jgi:hypothetical protein
MALILGLMLLATGGCKTGRMKTIAPIPVADNSAEETHDIVHGALVAAGWTVLKEEPGAMHALLSDSDWSAAILVAYDAKFVRIEYSDSSNLNYRKSRRGRETIHKNYNVWTKRLADTIRVASSCVGAKP